MPEIIKHKTCKLTGEEFPVYEHELKMFKKLSPKIGWEVFELPEPELSEKAREINRLMWRNERKFYNIEVDWEHMISTIHTDMRENIVSMTEFWEYDVQEFGVDYSWDFYSDYKKLTYSCPYANLLSLWNENSSYCNQEAYDKNCYLNSWWHENEDSMYNTFAIKSKDCVDNYWVFESEIVYDSLNIFESQKVFYSQ